MLFRKIMGKEWTLSLAIHGLQKTTALMATALQPFTNFTTAYAVSYASIHTSEHILNKKLPALLKRLCLK
jgi:hypothetical protein